MKFWIKALLPFILVSSYILTCILLDIWQSYPMILLVYSLFGIICEMIYILKTRNVFEISSWSFIRELIFWPKYSIIDEISESIKFFKYKVFT